MKLKTTPNQRARLWRLHTTPNMETPVQMVISDIDDVLLKLLRDIRDGWGDALPKSINIRIAAALDGQGR